MKDWAATRMEMKHKYVDQEEIKGSPSATNLVLLVVIRRLCRFSTDRYETFHMILMTINDNILHKATVAEFVFRP